MRVNIKGTKNKVAKVAILRPPITARASGAFCSPPSPSPSAIGSMPMIMAHAVMMMGRSRKRGFTLGAKIIRKGHEQDRIGCRHADRHDCSHQGWDIECGLS